MEEEGLPDIPWHGDFKKTVTKRRIFGEIPGIRRFFDVILTGKRGLCSFMTLISNQTINGSELSKTSILHCGKYYSKLNLSMKKRGKYERKNDT